MKAISARCSRARSPRSTTKRAPVSLAAAAKSICPSALRRASSASKRARSKTGPRRASCAATGSTLLRSSLGSSMIRSQEAARILAAHVLRRGPTGHVQRVEAPAAHAGREAAVALYACLGYTLPGLFRKLAPVTDERSARALGGIPERLGTARRRRDAAPARSPALAASLALGRQFWARGDRHARRAPFAAVVGDRRRRLCPGARGGAFAMRSVAHGLAMDPGAGGARWPDLLAAPPHAPRPFLVALAPRPSQRPGAGRQQRRAFR